MQVETFTPADGVMKPLGPYSHVAKAGPFIWISATAGVDPLTNELAGPDAYHQAAQILRALRGLLEGQGSGLAQVLHVQVYLLDMSDFEPLNRAFIEAFGAHRPARSVVAVAALPKPGARVTMSLNAVIGGEAMTAAG